MNISKLTQWQWGRKTVLWLWKRTLDHGHVSSEGWQEHTTWGSVSRSANFLVQDHKVNNLGCVGHTASVTTIWLCWCNVKAATATTHQRSRSKTDVLLTKEGWDREPWAGALPPHTHTALELYREVGVGAPRQEGLQDMATQVI